jgi:hypothetical protein
MSAVLVAAPGDTRSYRQSTAAILEEAQAIPEKVASRAQEPSPVVAQASSAAD